MSIVHPPGPLAEARSTRTQRPADIVFTSLLRSASWDGIKVLGPTQVPRSRPLDVGYTGHGWSDDETSDVNVLPLVLQATLSKHLAQSYPLRIIGLE